MLKTLISIFVLITICGCSKSDQEKLFVVEAVGEVKIEILQEISDALERSASDVVQKYGVKNFPTVTVKVWGDRTSFEESYGEDAQNVQGYVSIKQWEVHIFNGRPNLGLTALHEFTHLVSASINSTIANNPRWLWESVAIYESDRPPVPKQSELKCISQSTFPSLDELNSHPFNIYRIGYYLADYIYQNSGQEGLISLIETNGDIGNALGISKLQFENGFYNFMLQKVEVETVTSNNTSDC